MHLSALPPTPIALLVDGENLSKDLAPDLLAQVSRIGPAQVRRVYGNLNAVSGWENHGFRLCPTRPGKNSADMLLCVEAMMLVLNNGFETLVVASSDRDFSYLAEALREAGKEVIGVGAETAPLSFRSACSRFIVLQKATTKTAPEKVSASLVTSELVEKAAIATVPATSLPPKPKNDILSIVRRTVAEAGAEGMSLGNCASLNRSGIKISQTPEKTWRKWFVARGNIFICDAKGPDARVRLRR